MNSYKEKRERCKDFTGYVLGYLEPYCRELHIEGKLKPGKKVVKDGDG